MATRCHRAFYETPAQPLDQPNALIYRHWDGYPDAVLPGLVPFLTMFEQRRGMRDLKYLAARTLGHLMGLSDPESLLGYGIADSFHGDIEYVYAIYGQTRQIVVYELRSGDDAGKGCGPILGGNGFRPINTIHIDRTSPNKGGVEKAARDFTFISCVYRQALATMETPSSPEAGVEAPGRIAELNDLFRQTFLSTLGKVVTTPGIESLGELMFEQALAAVCEFDAFTPDNDPHGEHDFGAFSLSDGTKIFWKIDYYDKSMRFGSEDPADVTKTTRVLTIMLAEEY